MRPILTALFFLSGMAGLLFETLWFRQAGLTLGNGVWASSLVLSSFMIGLAIGNALVAQAGRSWRQPVRAFAGLELVIGASGIALVHGLPELTPLIARLLGPFVDEPWIVNPLRLAIGFVLLLVPATAMGATLPLLVKSLTRIDRDFGAALGRLYGWNTLGAVVGSIVGELLLIEHFGIAGTAWIAGSLDGLAALGALALVPRLTPAALPSLAHAPASLPSPDRDPAARPRLDGAGRRLLAAGFVSGACMLALEVVGFRFLLLFVDPGKLTFAILLAIVLCGLALGSIAVGHALRRWPHATDASALVALAGGTLVVVTYANFQWALAPFSGSHAGRPLEIAALALALLGPVALASGALFPLLGASLHARVGDETAATGWLTLSNTLGSGVGSLLAGFVLLPRLGMERSFFAIAIVYGVSAVLVGRPVAARSDARPGSRLPVGHAIGAVYAIALLAFPHALMQDLYLRTTAERLGHDGLLEWVATREGTSETILYLREDFLGRPRSYSMATNGYSMSGTPVQAKRYMKLYVYLPAMLHEDLEDALLISYGVGSTAKALVDTKSLRRIDVVDVSSEILEMSSIVYPDPATHPLNDPRVHVHVEDGRYFLESTDRRYDLITGEPPPPKAAGVVNLYTREYFAAVRARLRDGGINTYWLPVHSLTDDDAKAILRAYCDVFDDCSLWAGSNLDWMLVGSRGGRWHRDPERFTRLWHDPAVAPELRALGFEKPEQMGALFLADAADLERLARDVAPLVDDFPQRLSRTTWSRARAERVFAPWMDTGSARDRFAKSAFVRSAWPEALIAPTLPFFETQALINALGFSTIPSEGPRERALHAVLRRTDLSTLVLWLMNVDEAALAILDDYVAHGGDATPYATMRVARALSRRDYADAVALLRSARAMRPDDGGLISLELFALCLDGRVDEAETLVSSLFGEGFVPPDDSTYWHFMRETFGLAATRIPADRPVAQR